MPAARIRLGQHVEPITDGDDAIAAAVADAPAPVALAAAAAVTGDLSLLRPDLRGDPAQILDRNGGLPPDKVAEAHRLAGEALVRFRDAGSRPAALDDTALEQVIEFVVAGRPEDDYVEVLREELGFGGADLRQPAWHKDAVAPDRSFVVGIVGAGMSGLAAAYRLRQAGVDVVIFEKNHDVGGTWLENTYPGCRVDVPNHLYSFSFAQTGDWPGYFSTQDVLLDYFRACADELGIRPLIRFDTEVVDAVLDEATQHWRVTVRRTGTGGETATETVEVDALVSAVGQLNRPRYPDIPGQDRFGGQSFHSARWDHDVHLGGKRVAVIGTGASAAQFIPAVADQADELTVFQRNPPWLVPTPEYHDELPAGVKWLRSHVPGYAQWDRLWLFWMMHEGMLPLVVVDPDWDDGGLSVSPANDMLRQMLVAYLRGEFPEDELFEQVVPQFPPSAKRIIRDNGIWARTLRRDNVRLVTEKIEEITEKGVRTADGVEHLADVVIYGTGFTASEFLVPMTVRGIGGVDLHEQWAGEATAYLGIVVPNFPNLFLLYGPNTNIVINGSIVYFSECEVHYVVDAVRLLLEGGHRSMDVRADVAHAYAERVDAANRRMAWGVPGVTSWYKSGTGRVTQNWPFSLLEYWQQTRHADPADYVLR